MAEEYLKNDFPDGTGYLLLVDAAAANFDGFKRAFRFKPDEIRDAESSHNYNIRSQINYLLVKWFIKDPTVSDLRRIIEEWKNTKLLRQLGLNSLTIPEPVEKKTLHIPPAPQASPNVIEILKNELQKTKTMANEVANRLSALNNQISFMEEIIEKYEN